MPATLEQLTSEALSLPEALRAVLAQRILDSLPAPAAVDVGDGYFLTGEQVGEIRRRAESFKGDQGCTAEEFFSRLAQRG